MTSHDEGGGSPGAKRMRLEEEEEQQQQQGMEEAAASAAVAASVVPIEAILPDSLIKPITFERCVIATLGDRRMLSQFIQEINRAFPLPTFQHLKRVRDGRVLLFPLAMVDQDLTASGNGLAAAAKTLLVDRRVPQSLIEACSAFAVEELAAVAPQLKSQYSEVARRWPCKFHEDKALEKLSRNEIFNPREIRFHRRMMSLCFDLRSVVRSECVALAFDPAENEIVAIGWKAREMISGDGGDAELSQLLRIIPSGHAAMRVIDNVAARQGGGAWKDQLAADQDTLQTGLAFVRDTLSGFRELVPEKAEALKFGAYLCTGFDVYLTHEPCLMCSMAMVHSRVRRIFFERNSAQNGALGGGGQLKLHGVKELNHHFQVFRVNAEGASR